MKIERVALITILNAHLAKMRDIVRTRYDAALAEYETNEREYVVNTHDAWRETIQVITEKLDAEEVIRREDLPREIRTMGHDLRFFSHRRPSSPSQTSSTERQIERLVEILHHTTDEYVSTTSLEKMGFPLGRVLTGRIS